MICENLGNGGKVFIGEGVTIKKTELRKSKEKYTQWRVYKTAEGSTQRPEFGERGGVTA